MFLSTVQYHEFDVFKTASCGRELKNTTLNSIGINVVRNQYQLGLYRARYKVEIVGRRSRFEKQSQGSDRNVSLLIDRGHYGFKNGSVRCEEN